MDRDIQREKLKQGFAELTPDCWEEISNAVSERKFAGPVQDDIYRQPAHKRMKVILAAAAVMLCLFFVIKDANTVKSMLYIDVNPSVCISINDRGKVVKIDGINKDGRTVVDAVLPEIGSSRDFGTAVSCIITEIGKEGYFSSGTVDALVSLSYSVKEDKGSLDTARKIIEEYAHSNDMKVNLVVQSFAGNETVKKEANDMGISAGKYIFLTRLAKEGRINSDKICDFAEKSTGEIEDYPSESNDTDNESEVSEPDEKAAEGDAEVKKENKQKDKNESSVNKGKSSESKGKSSVNKDKSSVNKGKAQEEKKQKQKKEKKTKNNNGKSSAGKSNKVKNGKN